jgi:hypothetical protein
MSTGTITAGRALLRRLAMPAVLASIHRGNRVIVSCEAGRGDSDLGLAGAWFSCRSRICAARPQGSGRVVAGGLPGGLGPWERGDRFWAGQAECAGGPVAASKRFIHSVWRCQPSGRWMVMLPRPWRAVRAATLMRSRRMVAPRALA